MSISLYKYLSSLHSPEVGVPLSWRVLGSPTTVSPVDRDTFHQITNSGGHPNHDSTG